ncbi:MAG TPA: PQQ-binding-like beta-propeller repeat protein [Solirubrobacteraceae bacterium]
MSPWGSSRFARLCALAIASIACAGAGSVVAASAGGRASAAGTLPAGDWPTWGYDAERSGVGPSNTGITAANLRGLKRITVDVDQVVDAAPIELHAVPVEGRSRDVIVVTTIYGQTIAIDAASGRKLWEYAPPDLHSLLNSPQVTTTTPVADPDRKYVYAASPDGYVQKLALSSGRQVWRTRVTFDPTREKLDGALNVGDGSLLVVLGGYYGDAPVYQGHVAELSLASGRITRVFNSLCSNIHGLIDPPNRCHASDSAIWGRGGTILESNGDILVATANGPFDGRTNWGDSVLELSPTLRLLHNWTPVNQAQLDSGDMDLGSTEPALLPAGRGPKLAVQGGKDGILRVLDLSRLDGTAGPAGSRTGGELQQIDAPGQADVFSQPAVWRRGGQTFVFVADSAGTTGYSVRGGRLHPAWSDGTPGTSPVIAGGLLYVYDMQHGVLNVRNPFTGRVEMALQAGPGHWQSPIVVGGRIILADGNYMSPGAANIFIYHLPTVR